jgi:hypothetical protein
MNSRKKAALFRRALVLIAFGAVVTVGYGMYHGRGEKDDFANAEAKLQLRMDEYLALRRADDWVALYQMTNPKDRAALTLNEYLSVYAHGVIKLHEVRADRIELDPVRREARAFLTTDGELIPSRLPAKYRRGFREEHPERLRQTTTHELDWVWLNGQWFYQIDRDVVSRADASGRSVSFDHDE